MAHSHPHHSSHSSHNSYSSYNRHKSYNPHHVATSVIATYLIFGDFSDIQENLFYVNENYYTYNITYYVKQMIKYHDDYECIYYIVNENFNNETIIDASNMKIIENVSLIDDYGYDFQEFCRTFDNGSKKNAELISIIIIILMLCCCVNCMYNIENHSYNLY